MDAGSDIYEEGPEKEDEDPVALIKPLNTMERVDIPSPVTPDPPKFQETETKHATEIEKGLLLYGRRMSMGSMSSHTSSATTSDGSVRAELHSMAAAAGTRAKQAISATRPAEDHNSWEYKPGRVISLEVPLLIG